MRSLAETCGIHPLARRHLPRLQEYASDAAIAATTRGAVLEAELAAGNTIRDTHRGWPDPDSVVVTLQEPFRGLPSPLPRGLEYGEPGDPHWWRDEVRLGAPRQWVVW